MTRFILVRHGQTEWNRVERFRGRADVPLNDVGLAQAVATGRRIAAEWQPMAVYTSPLSRAVVTAQAIAAPFDLPVTPLDGLADIHYGDWQGLTPEEARARWPDLLHAWYTAPATVQIPGGESLADLRERAMAAIRELAVSTTPIKTIVLVSHTVVNRVILLAVLGLGNDRFWRLRQDNCAINVFEAEDGDFTLVSHERHVPPALNAPSLLGENDVRRPSVACCQRIAVERLAAPNPGHMGRPRLVRDLAELSCGPGWRSASRADACRRGATDLLRASAGVPVLGEISPWS